MHPKREIKKMLIPLIKYQPLIPKIKIYKWKKIYFQKIKNV